MLAATVVALLAGTAIPSQVAAGSAPAAAELPPRPGMAGRVGVAAQPGLHAMYGVAAIAPDYALAVGVGGDDLSVRARRWDGDRWLPTKAPGGSFAEMWAVSAITPTDVWGVGNAQGRALANHWDGASWTRVPTPNPDPSDRDYLHAVDGAGADDVWAVGHTRLDDGGNETEPLIEHWDGEVWTKVGYKLPYGNAFGRLTAVTVVSATDAWAVGLTYGARSAPLLLHWNGNAWKPVKDVIGATNQSISVLNAVDAITTDDIWAVGAGGGPVLLHWNGVVWTRVPARAHYRDWLVDGMRGVTAVAADDVWAVGGYGDGSRPDHNRILHWNGTRWHRVPSPEPGSTNNELWAVSATGPDNAWAVGSFNDGLTDIYLYLHWDGQRWTRVRANGEAPS